MLSVHVVCLQEHSAVLSVHVVCLQAASCYADRYALLLRLANKIPIAYFWNCLMPERIVYTCIFTHTEHVAYIYCIYIFDTEQNVYIVSVYN